jgi:TolB-like protein/DNA-binding winged helix-turn-helix (wHTH) protein
VGLECYRIGDLLLDAGKQEVIRNGVVVPVPRLSFKLLLSLARHAPNVVSIEQLEREVWEGLVVDRGTINKRVLLLRKALSTDEGDDRYIAVIRGSGYRLIAQVERVECSSQETGLAANGRRIPVEKKPGPMRNFPFWLFGIVALLAVYHGFQMTTAKIAERETIDTVTSGAQPSSARYNQTTIAVLPFLDLSETGSHQYLGDGIAEEVINLLTAMDGLQVAARTSSFSFRNSDLTTLEIAPRLRVGTILEGSVRSFGDRIRVTAQLIDTRTGFHIWSQNYDRLYDEIFEVQDDIAFNIAHSLKLTLDESNQIDSERSTTSNIEAFELYLKGRDLYNNRIKLRADGLRDALDYFTKAVELDPGFVSAHAGIARATWLLTTYDDSVDEEAYFHQAETSAMFALELNPRSADALSSLASVHALRGDIERAAAYFEQIRMIGSDDSNIYHWEAMLHLRLGYFEELIEPLSDVLRLDPFNEHIAWTLAAAHNFSGTPQAALVILDGLEHFTYRQYVSGLSAINSGNYNEARKLLRNVRMRSGILPAAFADSIIDALEDPAMSDEVALTIVSVVNNGELSELVGFESLLVLGSSRAFDLGIDPMSDIVKIQMHSQVWNNWAVEVRKDPRFKEWVEALGYVDFWRKHGWPDRCRPTGPDDFECI